MISIIIPTYNEEAQIGGLLRNLFALPGDFEVIVVDGESRDGTSRIVDAMRGEWPNRLRLMEAERNRAIQLNRGAEKARGDTLLFLHADARLPEQSLLNLERELSRDGIVGGNFDLEFDGKGFWDRAFSSVNRWRRRLGFYYGDSGIFVRRRVFDRLGGYRPMPILEDYEFARRLEASGRTAFLHPPLAVSSRRWQVEGVGRTLWSWVIIQGLYLVGVSADRLAGWYQPVRKPDKN